MIPQETFRNQCSEIAFEAILGQKHSPSIAIRSSQSNVSIIMYVSMCFQKDCMTLGCSVSTSLLVVTQQLVNS